MSAKEYVYAYINKETKEPDYIGRAKNADRLAQRLREHASDKWYHPGDYEIRFTIAKNRACSEALETEAIVLTQPKYNKDKKDWGTTGGFDDEIVDPTTWLIIPEVALCSYQGIAHGLKEIEKEFEQYLKKQI